METGQNGLPGHLVHKVAVEDNMTDPGHALIQDHGMVASIVWVTGKKPIYVIQKSVQVSIVRFDFH